jgi:putative phosphoribosyl transferase
MVFNNRTILFKDRTTAGQRLARELMDYANRQDVIVLALPRGGVPVAFEVAQALNAPLDVFLVRKLGVPGHEELAMGAIASGGIRVLNRGVVRSNQLFEAAIHQVTVREQRKLEQAEHLYRDDRPASAVKDKTIILVDDGMATGATLRAAITALQKQNPAHIIAAVPVAPAEVCQDISTMIDDVVCAETPEPFESVGLWYDNFSQVPDETVRELLRQANFKNN